MTEIALQPSLGSAVARQGEFPQVKPRWLTPATTVAVVLAHIGLGALLMAVAIEKIAPLDSLNAELMPEGDMFESEEVQAMDDTPPPQEIEQPDMGIPPPMVMNPEAPPIPVKKEVVEPKKQRVVERREPTPQAHHRQEASERHRIGVAGGRATGGLSQAAYKAMLAGAIRRHVPSVSSLGPGSAHCSFHVTGGGGMAGISCSGSSPSHAALLRSAIAATHAPPPPGGGFFAAQSVNFR